jgi:hypothetical protein
MIARTTHDQTTLLRRLSYISRLTNGSGPDGHNAPSGLVLRLVAVSESFRAPCQMLAVKGLLGARRHGRGGWLVYNSQTDDVIRSLDAFWNLPPTSGLALSSSEMSLSRDSVNTQDSDGSRSIFYILWQFLEEPNCTRLDGLNSAGAKRTFTP